MLTGTCGYPHGRLKFASIENLLPIGDGTSCEPVLFPKPAPRILRLARQFFMVRMISRPSKLSSLVRASDPT